jgi:hypothetical protein
MSIYATLHTRPTCHHTHEVIYITRGASAELMYILYNRNLTLTDIEQITFTFKQGRNTQWCSMFDFTTDAEGKPDKKVDPHFYSFYSEDYGTVILFNLDSEETKQLKPGIPVEWEVAVKLNTDSFASSGKDSTIIEPQHPIEVRDSLFSYVKEN